ncbi:MAG: HD domain-containing protein [Lachnospiraceae bacterium]|nr:HD domain-containing protein [Lachnospiraceae bacterium]
MIFLSGLFLIIAYPAILVEVPKKWYNHRTIVHVGGKGLKGIPPVTVHNKNNRSISIVLFVVTGIILNVAPAYLADRYDIPLFLDMTGTILVSAVAGYFPGIVTAVFSNVICTVFNESALFFSFINAIVALFTVWYTKRIKQNRPVAIVIFVLSIAFISAALSGPGQWMVFGKPQNRMIEEMSVSFSQAMGMGMLASFMLVNLLLNIIDKGLSAALAVVLEILMPKSLVEKIRIRNWRQRPLSSSEKKSLRKWSRNVRISIAKRTSIAMACILLLSVFIMGFVGIRFYFENEKKDRTRNAVNAATLAASVVAPDRIDEFIQGGKKTPGYSQTEDMLYRIRDNEQDIKYLYVIRIEDKGCRVAFDLETPDTPASEPGDIMEFEETFEPFLQTLFEGGEIEPVESKDKYGLLITVYRPIKNKKGETKGYACADVSLDFLTKQMTIFIISMMMALGGFFILIVAFELWMTGVFSVYPIASIASCVENFSRSGDDQAKLDENVKSIRALDVKTGDELEKLYHSICEMSLEQTEQMRSIRYFADTTAKMQDGLIITMANMVENRDSDTGAHIQKTAAYVKVIVEGLKKKGYYPEKISTKFISDVVRSAPLHDVGKINISDRILNKPGKLTDEEYEIMKTHTTAGKKILEDAISTTSGGNYLKEARNMAAYHHERWDGKGYPEGLYGEVIPLSARIMAVADVFDALTSPRVYKPAFPLEKALEILEEGAGSQFDPKCVEVFIDDLPEVKVILKKYNGQ